MDVVSPFSDNVAHLQPQHGRGWNHIGIEPEVLRVILTHQDLQCVQLLLFRDE